MVHVKDSGNDIAQQIAQAAKLLAACAQHECNAQEMTINCSKLTFLRPLLNVLLAILQEEHGFEVIHLKGSTKSYYGHIFRSLNSQNIQTGKTYIPVKKICKTPTSEFDSRPLTDWLTQLKGVSITSALKNAVTYLVSEVICNIEEHASTDCLYVNAQSYPSNGYLELAIADCGIGLLESYKTNQFDEVTSMPEAFQYALNGQSTKVQEQGRGFGIRTSRAMLHRGLKGRHILWSGNAFSYFDSQLQKDVIKTFPQHTGVWYQGTIAYFRIPLMSPTSFNYISYL